MTAPLRSNPPPVPVTRASRRRYLLPGTWIHVSSRTLGGRHTFVPRDPDFTRRVWGIVGRANRRYGVQLAAFALLSGHWHAMVRSWNKGAISAWNQYVKARLAMLAHEYEGDESCGTVWNGPFRSSNLLDDAAEMGVFAYIIAHGTKELLVPSPVDWPGAHCAKHLYDGTPIDAVWFDRAAWEKATSRDSVVCKSDYFVKVKVELTPLAAWTGRSVAWRETCRRVIDDIVLEFADRKFFGVDRVKSIAPSFVPVRVKRTPCPCFEARGELSKELLETAYDARRLGVEAAVLALRLLVRRDRGQRIGAHGDADFGLPDACCWPPLIADALDQRPIVAEFLPPSAQAPPADEPAAA